MYEGVLSTPFAMIKGKRMFELNPIRTQLADLAERTNVLRGYL